MRPRHAPPSLFRARSRRELAITSRARPALPFSVRYVCGPAAHPPSRPVRGPAAQCMSPSVRHPAAHIRPCSVHGPTLSLPSHPVYGLAAHLSPRSVCDPAAHLLPRPVHGPAVSFVLPSRVLSRRPLFHPIHVRPRRAPPSLFRARSRCERPVPFLLPRSMHGPTAQLPPRRDPAVSLPFRSEHGPATHFLAPCVCGPAANLPSCPMHGPATCLSPRSVHCPAVHVRRHSVHGPAGHLVLCTAPPRTCLFRARPRRELTLPSRARLGCTPVSYTHLTLPTTPYV